MVKADGSVSIHADDRAYKPLNWMSPPCKLQEAPGRVEGRQQGRRGAADHLEEIFHDTSTSWASTRPGQGRRRGAPAGAAGRAPGDLGDGFTLVRREYMTAIGPVDLLCRDAAGGASRSRSSAAARSTASSSSPATSSC
jgi:RecB family endonuclease NucS